MVEHIRILCVDDEKNVLKAIQRLFLDEDYEILTAESGEEGLLTLAATPGVQVVLSDYRMPGINGVDFLKEVCNRWPETVRMVISGYADTAAIVSAINEGKIYRFIPKPWNDDELRTNVLKAIEIYNLHRQNKQLNEELLQKNKMMQDVNENLERLVLERTSELILQNRALAHSQNILQKLPVGVVVVLPDGVLVQFNNEAAYILGKEIEDLLGEKMDKVLPPELCALVERVVAEQHACMTAAIRGRKMRVRGTCIVEDGQCGIVLLLDDHCWEHDESCSIYQK